MAKKSRRSAKESGASGAASGGGDELDRSFGQLWKSIAVGDVLGAEFQAAVFASLPELTHGSLEEAEELADLLIDAASNMPTELDGAEAPAFCRLLMSLGSRGVKRAASRALADFTADGSYPPGWVTDIGKPTPGRAWRQYDVFGEREVIAVTFNYGDDAHALLVGIDLAEQPTAAFVAIGDDADGMLATLQDNTEPQQRFAEITLAAARARMAGPLARAGDDPDFELDDHTIQFLPLARSRVRRLPSEDPEPAAGYTAADRAAAVEEFFASPEAGTAGDPDAARFWATVLTGYSSRVPDEPPGQVGPHKLAAALLVHVASTFTLTAAQREGMAVAVTAWTRWAVGRQGLDEAAADRALTRLPELLDEFPAAYDHPHSAASRGYLRDLAAPDVDLRWLADQRARREFAAPLPGDRDPGTDGLDDADSVDRIDATDSRGRTEIALAEFAGCADGGTEKIKLITALTRIVDEIWDDNPGTTWEKAKKLLAEGHDRHEVIHRLAH